jgi:hypothetical protein
MFQADDLVMCVDNSFLCVALGAPVLTLGKVYTVDKGDETESTPGGWIRLVGVSGVYATYRFEKVSKV